MVATTFWETFFLILIFLPLALVWGFSLVDIFRRDELGGGAKAVWVLSVLVFPLVGTLVYLATRRRAQTREYIAAAERREPAVPQASPNGVSELATLADLHDRGKLTDDEFAAEKARLLGGVRPAGSDELW